MALLILERASSFLTREPWLLDCGIAAPLQGKSLSPAFWFIYIYSHGFVKKLSTFSIVLLFDGAGDANHTKIGDLPIKILNKERCILQWGGKGDLWTAEGPGLPAGNS
jgi:hypothetical protein